MPAEYYPVNQFHYTFGLALALTWLVGCPEPCTSELKNGTTYGISVVDYYTPEGPYSFDRQATSGAVFAGTAPSCAGNDGIVPNTAMNVRVTGTASVGGGCDALVGIAVNPPTPVTIKGNLNGTGGVLGVAHQVSIGGCDGRWLLQFLGGGRTSLFDEPVHGQLPPAVMHRVFQPSKEDASCKACQDSFVIRFARK